MEQSKQYTPEEAVKLKEKISRTISEVEFDAVIRDELIELTSPVVELPQKQSEVRLREEAEKDRINSLKKRLLNGIISFEETRNELIVADRSTPSRDASEENLEFLYDPQIAEFVDSQQPEVISGYYRLLSFTEFHVAQRLAADHPQEAIEHFRKALGSAERGRSSKSWVSYIEGTLLYMEGREIPDDLITKIAELKNADVLRSLNIGLQQRGRPSYLEDYTSAI